MQINYYKNVNGNMIMNIKNILNNVNNKFWIVNKYKNNSRKKKIYFNKLSNSKNKIKNKIKTKNSKKFIRKKCKKILKMNNKIK